MARRLDSILTELRAGHAMRFNPPIHVIPADGESRGEAAIISYPVLSGRYPLVSPESGVTMLNNGSGASLPLSKLLARAPDVFVGSGVTATTLRFEVSRWVPGTTWNSNRVECALRELLESDGHDELKPKLHDMQTALERGEARDTFAAIRQLRKTIVSLNGNGPMSGAVRTSVEELYKRMQESAFAVRANFPVRSADLAGTTMAISSMSEGEGVLLGLKKRLGGDGWQRLMEKDDAVRTLMRAHHTEESGMLFVDWGVPFCLAGAVRAVMVEPSSSEMARVFLDDWERRPQEKLLSRIDKGRAEQLQSLAPMSEDDVKSAFIMPAVRGGHRISETHTQAYRATCVKFASGSSEPFEMPLLGAAAYVVAIGGDIALSTRAPSSQAVVVPMYEAAIVPPMAGSNPNILSITAKGSLPTALIVRPV